MGKRRVVTKEGEQSTAESGAVKASKKKIKRVVPKGIAFIFSSYNNTIITFTDPKGDVLAWTSAGSIGFKGARKSTPYAATLSAKTASEKAKLFGLSEVEVRVNGVGPGREAAIRGIVGAGIEISSIVDITPIPHNGCRPRKPRRV